MAIDLVMGLPPEESNYGHSMQDYLKRLQRDTFYAFQLAMKHLRASAERRKKSYNIRVKAEQFQVGDWVYYHYPRRYQKKSPKWQKSYIGPYLATRMIAPVNYVLQRSAKSKPFVVHADKLKRCYGETPKCSLSQNDQ